MKPETAIQINIVSKLSTLCRDNNFIVFSVPNEGIISSAVIGQTKKENYALTNMFKKMGLLPGVSDLIVLQTGRAYCLEVKTPDGEQSEGQILFEQWCIDNGVPYAVVRSVDEVVRKLREWGVVR